MNLVEENGGEEVRVPIIFKHEEEEEDVFVCVSGKRALYCMGRKQSISPTWQRQRALDLSILTSRCSPALNLYRWIWIHAIASHVVVTDSLDRA